MGSFYGAIGSFQKMLMILNTLNIRPFLSRRFDVL